MVGDEERDSSTNAQYWLEADDPSDGAANMFQMPVGCSGNHRGYSLS
jgi:hypothetical protein